MASKVAMGIDIGGTSVKSGLACLQQDAWTYRAGSTVQIDKNRFSHLRDAVAGLVREALQAGDLPDAACIGISTTGIVDCDERIASAHFYADYAAVSWKTEIQREFGNRIADVAVLNDGNAAAWAQYAAHAPSGLRDLIHLSIGTGVGGGIIVDGKLLLGATCAAGELGHVVVVTDGRVCQCGRRGCVQAYAGSRSIVEIATHSSNQGADKLIGTSADFRQVVELAAAGNRAAAQALEQAGHYLGIAIASLANALNPKLVTLGGGVIDAVAQRFDGTANPLLDKLRQTVQASTLTYNLGSLEVVPAEHGNDASWIGAATYAAARQLDSAK